MKHLLTQRLPRLAIGLCLLLLGFWMLSLWWQGDHVTYWKVAIPTFAAATPIHVWAPTPGDDNSPDGLNAGTRQSDIPDNSTL